MGTAEIIVALVQTSQVLLDIVAKHQRGEMTDEGLKAAWAAMQGRLGAVSDRIQS